MGLFGARRLTAHEVVAWMRDGRKVGAADDESGMEEMMRSYDGMRKRYMYMIRGGKGGYALMDGERARAGGAKRANDARGLRQGNNVRFYVATIPALAGRVPSLCDSSSARGR